MATVAELEAKLNELTSRVEAVENHVTDYTELKSRVESVESYVENDTDNQLEDSNWIVDELDGVYDEDGNRVHEGLFDHVYGTGVRPVRQLTQQQAAAAEEEQRRLEAELAAANKRAASGRR